MKRSLQTLGVSAAFLFLSALVTFCMSFIEWEALNFLYVAIGVYVVSVVLALIDRKTTATKIITIGLNAFAFGIAIRSWYILRGFDNPLWLMFSVGLLAAAYMFVFILPLYVPAINNHYGIYLLIFILISIGGYVCLVIFTKTTWVSTLGYYGLIQLGFIISLSFSVSNKRQLFSSWQLATFAVVMCAIIIILAIITEGDGVDGLFDGLAGCDVTSPKKDNSLKKTDLPK